MGHRVYETWLEGSTPSLATYDNFYDRANKRMTNKLILTGAVGRQRKVGKKNLPGIIEYAERHSLHWHSELVMTHRNPYWSRVATVIKALHHYPLVCWVSPLVSFTDIDFNVFTRLNRSKTMLVPIYDNKPSTHLWVCHRSAIPILKDSWRRDKVLLPNKQTYFLKREFFELTYG